MVFVLTGLVVSAQSPGLCIDTKTSKDCQKYPGYQCVSVHTDIPAIGIISQCVNSTNFCGGSKVGRCPTFTSWSTPYQQIQPLCGFQEVPNCLNGEKTVDCVETTLQNENGGERKVIGIYKCVDRKMYQNKSLGFLDLTPEQIKSCEGNQSTPQGYLGLCHSHGTCAPIKSSSPKFMCVCNAGYNINDNCLSPVDNSCDSLGQCGDRGSCDLNTGKCVCKTAAVGDQCSKCDAGATAEFVCNGQGTCGIDGICRCKKGYQGIMCETVNNSKSPMDSSGLEDPSSAIVASVSSIVLGAIFIYWM
jgi:hypothetical protein